jgi:hypothetical protein
MMTSPIESRKLTIFVALIGFCFTFQIQDGSGQSVAFTAKAKVDGDNAEINEGDIVTYDGDALLEAASGAAITPPLVGTVEVRCTWSFSGTGKNGTTYGGNQTATKTLTSGDDVWVRGQYSSSSNDAVGTWVYTFKVEKKVNGTFVPITGGAMSITFKENGGGGGGMPPVNN